MKQAQRTGLETESAVSLGDAQRLLDYRKAGALPVVLRSPRRSTAVVAGSGPERHIELSARIRHAVTLATSRERDRGLAFLFIPVAMGTGSGLFYMAATDPPIWLIAILFVAALLVAFSARSRYVGAARCAGYVAAVCIGALAAGHEASTGAVLLDSDVTTTVTGAVEARAIDAGGSIRYLVRLHDTTDPRIRRPPELVRLSARPGHQPVPLGATITGRARLTAPSGPALPGGYDFAFRAFVDGIGAYGYFYRAPGRANTVPDLAIADGTAGLLQSLSLEIETVREQISARIRRVLPGDPGGIAAALAVSDRRGISEATVEALRATGLAHILAISGLHMALAAGTLYLAIRKTLSAFPALAETLPVKKFAAVVALMAATAYLLISGGSVSTQRAWVMLAVMLVAVLADRPALTMRNVAIAAIAIILVTPSAVVGPGFQMSFAATAALIAAYAVICERFDGRQNSGPTKAPRAGARRLLVGTAKALLGLAITSLVAGLATGLFSAHHFHRIAGAGLLANLLAMPLVTLVVMPAGLVAMLAMPFGLDEWPLRLMGQGLEGVIAVAGYVNAMSGDVTVGQLPLAASLMMGAGLVVLVLLKSWLRCIGLALIAVGVILALPPVSGPRPQVLVSEAGDLVVLVGPAALASNADRPSEFVFRQWQTAMAGLPHRPPARAALQAEIKRQDPASVPDTGGLDRLLDAASREPFRFHCASRGLCAASHFGAKLIAIDEAALIGAACDRADLVIVSIPVYLHTCRSGATLVTSRMLRRSGALAITLGNGGGDTAMPHHQEGSKRTGRRPDIEITAALQGVVRPWTVQRYYDWRSDSYDLPGSTKVGEF